MALPNTNPARYMVTAALPYANGPLHIGHLAGAYLPADIYVRYLRLVGKDVLFMCGSDEHGVAITIKALKEGITPKELVDKYHENLKRSFQDFGISVDNFSRTSAKIHHETSQEFFLKFYLENKFDIIESEQFFDEESNLFLADRYILGTCPKCGNPNAYGDQCEKCGSSLNPTDLIDPRSALSGKKPELKKTKHFYLPLNKYQEFVQNYLNTKKESWKSNVAGQCQSWLNDGLQPRAMTRDMDWGIPLPDQVEGGKGKVLYVWFDAPIGYISATKEFFIHKSKENSAVKPENWKPYWQSEDTKLVHFIGKDNIVFHCIVFPCILYAHGDYIWADDVPANEFLNLEGEKLSTSRNWAVWADDFVKDFPNQIDVLRYVLAATMPETKDNDFTWKDFQTRNNSELVEIFGNFINRVITLLHKYYNGLVPTPENFSEMDQSALKYINDQSSEIGNLIEKYHFRKALSEAMNLARSGNKYLAESEPWKLIKTEPGKVATIMYVATQISAALGIVFEPFMPEVSKKLRHLLNFDLNSWSDLGSNELISPGHMVSKPELLFSKIEDQEIDIQISKLHKPNSDSISKTQESDENKELAGSSSNSVYPSKSEIIFEDFDKIDIRIATILEAEKVKNADKLLKLKIDTGIDQRTIVSGIAKFYSPEEIIGKQILVLINLAPRKLKGIESQGMILMADEPEGKLIFVQPAELALNGSKVK